MPDDQREIAGAGPDQDGDGAALEPRGQNAAESERPDIPPAMVGGGGRFFLLVVFVGVAMGVLYYLEHSGGLSLAGWIPVYATVAALGGRISTVIEPTVGRVTAIELPLAPGS